ncbi:MAG: VWA domain-containing protein [Rhodobacteraceae bacterium]|nr:VWA domain-containing protein [Paracoccaceae bacterium]
MTLPAASAHLLGFGQLLRANGFLATPDQGIALLQSVEVLGPRSMRDIQNAAYAVFGPPPERRDVFQDLFDAHFLGRVLPELAQADAEDETDINEDRGGQDDPLAPEEVNEAGQQATRLEMASQRQLVGGEDHVLSRFRTRAPRMLPQRTSRRKRKSRKKDVLDMRRAMRRAVHHDGELLTLPGRSRIRTIRPILLLIDVSGSMKDRTDAYFRFAHSLKRLNARVEVFALGTQMTRVTRALALRNREQALARASVLIPDWDGGTRLGDTMNAFLAVPRYAGMARGAFVVTLSDGLERDSSDALDLAVRKLSRLCWQHLWLTPLSTGPEFVPQTEALIRIRDDLDGLGGGASTETICEQLLGWAARDTSNSIHRRQT